MTYLDCQENICGHASWSALIRLITSRLDQGPSNEEQRSKLSSRLEPVEVDSARLRAKAVAGSLRERPAPSRALTEPSEDGRDEGYSVRGRSVSLRSARERKLQP